MNILNIFSQFSSALLPIAVSVFLLLAAGTLTIMLRRRKQRRTKSAQQAVVNTPQQPEDQPTNTGPQQSVSLPVVPSQKTLASQIWEQCVRALLFLPGIFIAFLDMVHTKRFKYYGLVTGVIAIEAVFAFRAGLVYYTALQYHAGDLERLIIAVLVVVAIFLCGYMISTNTQSVDVKKEQNEKLEKIHQDVQQKIAAVQAEQAKKIDAYAAAIQAQIRETQTLVKQSPTAKVRVSFPRMPKLPAPPKMPNLAKVVRKERKWTLATILTAIVVVAHDWAGVIYVEYGPSSSQQSTANGAEGWTTLVVTIGMCALTILPFVMGAWAERLKPEMEAEKESIMTNFTTEAFRKIKYIAVEGVLSRIKTTDVVRLVQALPSPEFDEFKKFVLPIIGPNQPLELPAHTENPLAAVALPGGGTLNVVPIAHPKTASIPQENPADISVPSPIDSLAFLAPKKGFKIGGLPVVMTEEKIEQNIVQSTPIPAGKTSGNPQEFAVPKTPVLSEVKDDLKEEVKPSNTARNTQEITPSKQPEKTMHIEGDWSEVISKFPAVQKWLSSGLPTVSVEDIMKVTGFTKLKVSRAPLQATPRNKDMKKLPSVLTWLKTQKPVSIPERNTLSNSEGNTPEFEESNTPCNTQENTSMNTPAKEDVFEEENTDQSTEIIEEITDAIQEEKPAEIQADYSWAKGYGNVPLPAAPKAAEIPSAAEAMTDELPAIVIGELAHA